jgi:hypothetical protein
MDGRLSIFAAIAKFNNTATSFVDTAHTKDPQFVKEGTNVRNLLPLGGSKGEGFA